MNMSRAGAPPGQRRRNRPVYLMLSLFLMVLIQPAMAGKPFASLVMGVLVSLTVFSSALSVLRNRRLFVVICCLGLPSIALNWLSRSAHLGLATDVLSSVLMTAFGGTILTVMVANILTASTVTANTLCRAVSGYILIGLTWAFAYETVVLLDPSSIASLSAGSSAGEFMYFSVITMTTLGFGDITPVSPYARSLAMVQAIVGPMYLAILVARLVAMYQHGLPGEQG